MNSSQFKNISDHIVSLSGGFHNGRMTLIVSNSKELNETVIEAVLMNDIWRNKTTNHFPLYSGSFKEFKSFCEEESGKCKLDLVSVGEIQFFLIEDGITTYEHLSKLPWHFKKLAKDLNCHVIIGIAIDSFTGDKMTFRRLRDEVGNIEVDPDLILLIDSSKDEVIKIHCGKNRVGEIGTKTFIPIKL